MSTPLSSTKKRKARSATIENELDKSTYAASGSTIAVALRVRPFLQDECITNVLRIDKNKVAVLNGDGEIAFDFSFVFDMNSSLDTVYSEAASALVAQALDGYNVCVMAYGQTGSGKTYCMSGSVDDWGVIPRFCTDLFKSASARKDSDQRFTVSFYEIYQEKAYDLLDEKHIPLRVRGGEDVYLQNLINCSVNSFEELEKLRRTAWTRRATESTAMNRCSSRSHAFMQLTYSHLESNLQELGDYVSRVTSNIYFVDLAGSERLSEVGYSYLDAIPSRFLQETVSINSSLSALHRVIFSAGSRLKPSYRDSLLTRLLKDCLSGNARTLLIANVTPSISQRSETLSTLRFASQAGTVHQCAIKNIDPVVTALLDLKQENKALKTKIEQLESSQKLIAFGMPVAPSIVEFHSDPSLTTWEPLEKELSFSAFNTDSVAVKFVIEDDIITIVSHEEGIFVNGEYLYPNIPSRAEHNPNGIDVFRKCSYHSMKAEYLERNMERFRAEIAEIERNRRRNESETIVKTLVEEIENLKLALSEKDNAQEACAVKERENLQIELENCMTLKEAFLDLCKREISAFGVKFESLAELFEAYVVKRDVETANFILSHFNKEKVYCFEMVLEESTDGSARIRLIDYKSKMFADIEKSDFDSILRRLKDFYRQFLVPEEGFEIVGKFMFQLCRRKLQMLRIGGARMSNFAKTALYNSTVDAAKRRKTSVKEFRLSIGTLGDLPENDDPFKSQFIQRLIDICTFEGSNYSGDFVESLCRDIVELKINLMDIRAIQRGAISEGIGLFSVLCKFVTLVQKIEGAVGCALGFTHQLYVESCLKSISFAWRTFTEFLTSWMRVFGDSSSEETFEEVGPLCLDGMFDALNAVVVALGKMALFVGGQLPNGYRFEEIKEAFLSGSREAVTDVVEEAEDFVLRFQRHKNNISEIALNSAEVLIEVCKQFESSGGDNNMYDVISPLFAVLQLTSSCVVDPIECLSAERDFARKSYFHLKRVASSHTLSSNALDRINIAIEVCEKILTKPELDSMQKASPSLVSPLPELGN
uniref:Kinesin motor domain-containing protein n=1 Tax=Syphacia muris TaxID=451379 RepID=A0A0N5ADI9_9BILA